MASDDDPEDVLSRLPKTRPARRSTRRASADEGAATPKPKPKPKPAAKPKPTAAKPKAAATPPPKPKPATPPPASARKPIDPPTGEEILQSALQAAGDVVQVGLLIGRETLKAVRSRLPGGR